MNITNITNTKTKTKNITLDNYNTNTNALKRYKDKSLLYSVATCYTWIHSSVGSSIRLLTERS